MEIAPFLDFAKGYPMIALVFYLMWRQHSREDKTLSAFKDGVESQKMFGEAVRILARLDESQQRLHERITTLEALMKAKGVIG